MTYDYNKHLMFYKYTYILLDNILKYKFEVKNKLKI